MLATHTMFFNWYLLMTMPDQVHITLYWLWSYQNQWGDNFLAGFLKKPRAGWPDAIEGTVPNHFGRCGYLKPLNRTYHNSLFYTVVKDIQWWKALRPPLYLVTLAKRPCLAIVHHPFVIFWFCILSLLDSQPAVSSVLLWRSTFHLRVWNHG